MMPYVEIDTIDMQDYSVKTRGYYYHFINQYYPGNFPNIDFTVSIDEWVPINPVNEEAKLLFSIYIQDTTLTSYYEFPCDSTNLLFDENLGVEENQKLNNFVQLFPNPANTTLTISSSSELLNEVELLDVNGKQIVCLKPRANLINVDISAFQNGIYFVKCKNEKSTETLKFIKL